jgi:energy-coupling factor transporter ATP-binding protein EcfA2
VKIRKIVISNYRAFLVRGDFEAEQYSIDLGEGKNLLLYGENGSGKSSLYKAIKDFLASARNPSLSFSQNLFYREEDNSEKPYIRVTLDDGATYRFSVEGAATNTGSSPVIAQANVTRGFISYKDLLKLHFQVDGSDPDLFAFFLAAGGLMEEEVLLAPIQADNRVPFIDLWKKISEYGAADDIADYNLNARAKFESLEGQTNDLLTYFETGCSIRIEYTDCSITEEKGLVPPRIIFRPSFFGKDIGSHHDVLNEARLTALAIAVYFAHLLSLPPTDLRILFLDDIFTGLDMSNRLPLIEILTADNLGDGRSFRDYQIFLATYDRDWYEVAKSYLRENWGNAEFYVDDTQSPDRPYIRNATSYRDRAWAHFRGHDYPACANYQRKAFESVLKNILPEKMLYSMKRDDEVPADSAAILSKSRLSMAENSDAWFFRPGTHAGPGSFSSGFLGLQGLIDKFKSLVTQYQIPFRLVGEMESIKNRLLNPLSHDNLKSVVFRRELEKGFSVLDELQKINSRYIIDLNEQEEVFILLPAIFEGERHFTYKIQLLENLRFVSYEITECLLNAACKVRSRKRDDEAEYREFPCTAKSLQEACKRILQKAVPQGTPVATTDTLFVLENVFTLDMRSLRSLI